MDLENFQKYQSKLPNEDLVNIAFFERRKMEKEARKSAKSLLEKRNLSLVEIKVLKDEIRRRKRKESRMKLREKNNKYGILDFVFEIIFYS